METKVSCINCKHNADDYCRLLHKPISNPNIERSCFVSRYKKAAYIDCPYCGKHVIMDWTCSVCGKRIAYDIDGNGVRSNPHKEQK